MKSGCVLDGTYTEEWELMMLKKRLQYIYKQAFDHLPCAILQDSIHDNAECTTMVNIALVEINKCHTDSMFVSPVDTLQQGDEPMAWRQTMSPLHVSSNVSMSNIQIGLFLGYGKFGQTLKGAQLGTMVFV
jgi:hypothetical protein